VDLPVRFPMIGVDEFTIMPNHLHGIVTIVGAPLAGARPVDQPNGVDREHLQTTRLGSSTVRAGASPPLRWVPLSVRSNPCPIDDVGRWRLRQTRVNDSAVWGCRTSPMHRIS